MPAGQSLRERPLVEDDVWSWCWAEWRAKEGYGEDIRQHLQERGPLYRFLRNSLQHAGGRRLRVLEVGCGSAIDAHVLAEDRRLEVFGLDRERAALEVAKRISSHFSSAPTFLTGDARQLGFRDETFDVVFSQGLLEHFRDPLPVLREQVRVLKPSGYLILDVPQKYAGLGLYSIRKQLKIRKGTWKWGWETQYSYPEIKRLGRAVGLTPLGVGGYGFDGLFNFLANPHVMIDKKAYLGRFRVAQAFKRFYLQYLKQSNDRVWSWLCDRYGHWFLICIVVWFRKP